MTSASPPDGWPRYFVRRVPDVVTRWRRRRRCYEVGTFPAVGASPIQVEQTRTPEIVLRRAGQHTTDIADYVKNADAAWTAGTGPWRGMWPDRDPAWTDQVPGPPDSPETEPELLLPDDFDDHGWEIECKGWYPGASVRFGDRQVGVTFYDPTRLARDIRADLESEHLVSFAHLIVVDLLTVENMRRAVRRLDSDFFDQA
jgi:hypothetical protein